MKSQRKKKKKTSGKQNSRKKNTLKTIVTNKNILIPVENDTKKHIWIIIFINLYFSFSLMFFFLFFIQMLYMFIFSLILLELLFALHVLFCTLVLDHIGNYAHRVTYIFENIVPLLGLV